MNRVVIVISRAFSSGLFMEKIISFSRVINKDAFIEKILRILCFQKAMEEERANKQLEKSRLNCGVSLS